MNQCITIVIQIGLSSKQIYSCIIRCFLRTTLDLYYTGVIIFVSQFIAHLITIRRSKFLTFFILCYRNCLAYTVMEVFIASDVPSYHNYKSQRKCEICRRAHVHQQAHAPAHSIFLLGSDACACACTCKSHIFSHAFMCVPAQFDHVTRNGCRRANLRCA